MKYRILQPIINSDKIIGYEAIDETGGIKRFKLDDIYKLADAGIIQCQILLDSSNNKHILYDKVDNKDDDITYTVEYRIVNSNKLIGYKCKKSDGSLCRLSPSKAWDLAYKNKINNVKATIINNQKALIGKGTGLDEIETIET